MERGSIKGSYAAIVRIFEVLQEEISKRREGMKAKDVASTNIVQHPGQREGEAGHGGHEGERILAAPGL